MGRCIIHYAVVAALLFGMLGCAPAQFSKVAAQASRKDNELAVAGDLVKAVIELAVDNQDRELSAETSKRIVDTLAPGKLTTKELAMVAGGTRQLCILLTAEDERAFVVMEYASDCCVNEIASRKDGEAVNALHELQEEIGRDGGEALMFEELIEFQKNH